MLVLTLRPRRHGVDSRILQAGFVLDKVSLEQGFLRFLPFPLSVLFHRFFTSSITDAVIFILRFLFLMVMYRP
jgi:hypothetical protein